MKQSTHHAFTFSDDELRGALVSWIHERTDGTVKLPRDYRHAAVTYGTTDDQRITVSWTEEAE
jgi:hypothetical protein